MGGFTNQERDSLNLGKNYKYPDISGIEEKASDILPSFDIDYDNTVVIFTITVLSLMGVLMGILLLVTSNGMSIGNLFKSLKDNMRLKGGVRVSSKTIIMPK
jgi:hypothetical protein